MVPAQVPSYWLAYSRCLLTVPDKEHKKQSSSARDVVARAGGLPGWRFSLLTDPQGASFGLLRCRTQSRTGIAERAGNVPASFLFWGETRSAKAYEFPLPSRPRRSGDRQEAAGLISCLRSRNAFERFGGNS